MQSLSQVIAAIKKELDHALAENRPLSQRVSLEPERVVVTLHFSVEQEMGKSEPILNFSPGRSAANTLAIEFELGSRSATASEAKTSTPSAAPPTKTLTGPERDRVVQQLSRVFGAPGFDSSARATVFREAMENLTPDEVRDVLQTADGSNVDQPAAVKRARALVQRVCHAGPAGSKDGMQIVSGVFSEHPSNALLELVAAVWKTQEEWLG